MGDLTLYSITATIVKRLHGILIEFRQMNVSAMNRMLVIATCPISESRISGWYSFRCFAQAGT